MLKTLALVLLPLWPVVYWSRYIRFPSMAWVIANNDPTCVAIALVITNNDAAAEWKWPVNSWNAASRGFAEWTELDSILIKHKTWARYSLKMENKIWEPNSGKEGICFIHLLHCTHLALILTFWFIYCKIHNCETSYYNILFYTGTEAHRVCAVGTVCLHWGFPSGEVVNRDCIICLHTRPVHKNLFWEFPK